MSTTIDWRRYTIAAALLTAGQYLRMTAQGRRPSRWAWLSLASSLSVPLWRNVPPRGRVDDGLGSVFITLGAVLLATGFALRRRRDEV